MSEIDLQLWAAIGPENGAKVRSLLAGGANPNWPGDLGRTAVHRACLLNCPDQLDLLISAGGLIEAGDQDRETPLHLAALQGHLGIVKHILMLGADIERRSDYGTALDRAAFGGHVTVVAALLNAGADPNAKSYYGRTPLHQAAERGRLDVARLLLRRGAEVDAIDQFGNERTPLHEGIYPGAADLVDLLLRYGANVEHQNSWGATPLHMAARIGATDVVEALLQAGANPSARDAQGRAPIDEAIERHHSTIVTLLQNPVMRNHSATQLQIDGGSRLNRKTELHNAPQSALSRYQQAVTTLRDQTKGQGFMSAEEIELQTRVLQEVSQHLEFRYQPDGQQRIDRNQEAKRVVTGGTGFGSVKEIVSDMKVLTLSDLLELDCIKRQQELDNEVRWLSATDDPLLVIFVSHRWEQPNMPDPHGTQLWVLKTVARLFVEIALGFKENRAQRLERIPTLKTHGAMQAAYFVGAIADFVDGFQGGELALREQLLKRVGIVYDFMSLPQSPRTTAEEAEFLRGMMSFRRLMACNPVLVLRFPDDDYNSRSWCELEFWSAGSLSADTFATAPVVRTDLLGKEIPVNDLGPPSNYTSHSDFLNVLSALNSWQKDDFVTANDIAKTINRDYHQAFSLKEKEFKTPLVTRPETRAHNEPNILITPPSFQFWHSIRERLCSEGLENEDFAEILRLNLKAHHLECTDERDQVSTALWLLGCHELDFDFGFIVFYGRCLLRHFYEGKDLMISLFFRLPNQMVHFKFADGEETLEG